MNKQILKVLTIALLAVSIVSCSGLDAEEQIRRQFEEDMAEIEAYIQANNLTAERYPSGLHIAILERPGGENPERGRTVVTDYVGRLTNDTLFDTSIESVARAAGKYVPSRNYSPFAFILGYGEVIRAWDEGFSRLQRGDKAVLLVPSSLGYGNRGQGTIIPPNSVLIFEVNFVDFR